MFFCRQSNELYSKLKYVGYFLKNNRFDNATTYFNRHR